MLPSEPPHIDGFDIAGVFESAEATGGDFFDFIAMASKSGTMAGFAFGSAAMAAAQARPKASVKQSFLVIRKRYVQALPELPRVHEISPPRNSGI